MAPPQPIPQVAGEAILLLPFLLRTGCSAYLLQRVLDYGLGLLLVCSADLRFLVLLLSRSRSLRLFLPWQGELVEQVVHHGLGLRIDLRCLSLWLLHHALGLGGLALASLGGLGLVLRHFQHTLRQLDPLGGPSISGLQVAKGILQRLWSCGQLHRLQWLRDRNARPQALQALGLQGRGEELRAMLLVGPSPESEEEHSNAYGPLLRLAQ
mmetsp:Transcript_33974/g.94046  ORF Transcript_33974/g.94046 Transcript_33974/m.94046 type:complete len:210 (+) Transcript_33974:1-630(+)